MIRYPCGCVNEVHESSGILHSVSKCAQHRREARDPATWGRSHYASFGLLTDDDQLAKTQHVAQLVEALGPIPFAGRVSFALEIGCGVSPYVGAIESSRWCYTGIDLSRWATHWTANQWRVPTITISWEDWKSSAESLGLILCAHALEHMADAPAALRKMADALAPGGQLWLIVPDDTDPVNPEHLFFFTASSLRRAVEAVGLTVDRLVMRKYIERENFIYCRASKPA